MKRTVKIHGKTWSVMLEVGKGYTYKGAMRPGLDDVPHPAAIREAFRGCVSALRILTGHREKVKKESPQRTLW